MRVATTIRFDAKELQDSIDDLVKKVARDVEATARVNTPKRSGYARKNWRRKDSRKGFTVENTVPYIERLEAGASKQSPRGIIGPTLGVIKRKY